LNVRGIIDVRHKCIQLEPLVPEPSCSEDEVAIKKLKRHKSPSIDQVPAEWIQAGGSTLHSEIQRPILFEIRNIATDVKGIYHCTYL